MPHDYQDAVLVLPRLRVQNANAISSPMTWGFPSITAFIGMMHALARRLPDSGLEFRGVGVICHSLACQPYALSVSRISLAWYGLPMSPLAPCILAHIWSAFWFLLDTKTTGMDLVSGFCCSVRHAS